VRRAQRSNYEERDVQAVMQALLEIKVDLKRILGVPLEDNGEEAEEDEP
jgi:hypothetical protein